MVGLLVSKGISGTGRPADSRYVLILDLMEEVTETLCDWGPDERTEREKHTKRCQSTKTALSFSAGCLRNLLPGSNRFYLNKD